MNRNARNAPLQALTLAIVVALAAALSACKTQALSQPNPGHSRQAPGSGKGHLHIDPGGIVLPDRSRTPGAVNTAVTQHDIHTTICRTGYTDLIRPGSDYTTHLKESQLDSGYAYHHDTSDGDYEEDHLISLELGGAPSDPRNLWPEPYDAPKGARVKDLIENKLHDLVCSGRLRLTVAQHAIAVNWWTALQRYGGEGAPKVWDGAYAGASPNPPGGSSANPVPAGATARCGDGTYSYAHHRSGACSNHGGVAHWIHPPSA